MDGLQLTLGRSRLYLVSTPGMVLFVSAGILLVEAARLFHLAFLSLEPVARDKKKW
jgi:hypothetical protein